ncbi:hypothetical protein LCGC14_0476370 [marine sediment metagenome]|uniref:DNA cytosine methyltransferase n=1 Tax=marine sediment metagenome TaxID=412755 RepID=A0A0F9SFW9_9ZZZZ
MKILIACEESQEVCKAFRKLGHETYSCDILDCSGGHPEWHIKGDVLKHLDEGWDLMIAFPPCTYISRAGTRWLFPKGELNKERYEKGLKTKEFFMTLLNANIPRIVIENPVPHKVFKMPKETQIIQPFYFGHKSQKTTLLWIKDLPKLQSTNTLSREINPEYYICNKGWKHSKFTANWDAKKKSKTFSGIAKAMAEQWGNQSELKKQIGTIKVHNR